MWQAIGTIAVIVAGLCTYWINKKNREYDELRARSIAAGEAAQRAEAEARASKLADAQYELDSQRINDRLPDSPAPGRVGDQSDPRD